VVPDRTGLCRRQFLQRSLSFAAGVLLTGCEALRPQVPPAAKVPRVGYLAGSSSGLATGAAFRGGLLELGYVEGQTIVLESRDAESRVERLPDLAAELVGLNLDVVVTTGINGATAVRAHSSTIPIVVLAGSDPVQAGLAASFARPGNNVTGVTAISPTLSGKRLALLKEAASSIGRVGVLWNLNNPNKAEEWRETERAAGTLGLQVRTLGVRSVGDLERAFDVARAERVDALMALHEALTITLRGRIADFALASRLPSMFEFGEWTEAGGLLSYGPNQPAMYHRAAVYVDKILKGTPAGEIPIEQPTTFDFIVNLRIAQALGLTIPQSVLQQATEVIE
jgi:putative tryptophan/tyrosine transport system substrate-binding protein